jgi:RimJ/RimL family protein N-acetyltransferase
MSAMSAHPILIPVTRFDRELLADLFARMSRASRYARWLTPKPQITDAELRFLTDIDHRTHEALAAVDPRDGTWIGAARYVTGPAQDAWPDVAFEVADAWQGRGVGTLLLDRLLARAQDNGVRGVAALTLADNAPARALLRRFGFRVVGSSHGALELRRALHGCAAGVGA